MIEGGDIEIEREEDDPPQVHPMTGDERSIIIMTEEEKSLQMKDIHTLQVRTETKYLEISFGMASNGRRDLTLLIERVLQVK
jgi:hypothetical protein